MRVTLDTDGGGDLTFPSRTSRIDDVLRHAGLVALLALLAALCLVPDTGVLRAKAVWTHGLLAATASLVLLRQSLSGRLQARRPGVVVACLGPLLVAAAWLALGEPASVLLARDELLRLALFPVALWSSAALLDRPAARRLFAVALSLLAAAVAGFALAQNLSGLLGLPLDRAARAFATFGNPVFLGAFLVLVTPPAIIHALYGRGRERWLHAVAGGLCLPALLATGTRGAWLGFGVGTVVVVAGLTSRPAVRRGVLALVGVAILALVPFVSDHLQRPQQHALIWRDTLALVADHPLGVGPGQFPLAFVPYASRELLEAYPRSTRIVNDVHSEPLQLLAELGWAGLAAAALAVAALARAAVAEIRGRGRSGDERPFAVAAAAALAGAAAQSFVSPDQRFAVSGVLAGLVAATLFSRSAVARLPGPRGSVILLGAALACGWFAIDTIGQGLELRRRLVPADAVATGEGRELQQVLDGLERRRLLAALAQRAAGPGAHWADVLALGLVQQADGQVDAAIASYRRVLAQEPGNPQALAALGIAEVWTRRYDQALEHLRAARDLLPRSVDVRYWMARASLQVGDLAGAMEEVQALLELAPDHPGGHALLERLRE